MLRHAGCGTERSQGAGIDDRLGRAGVLVKYEGCRGKSTIVARHRWDRNDFYCCTHVGDAGRHEECTMGRHIYGRAVRYGGAHVVIIVMREGVKHVCHEVLEVLGRKGWGESCDIVSRQNEY